jgi:hypothetical protein
MSYIDTSAHVANRMRQEAYRVKSNRREYAAWASMIGRCTNLSHANFKYYGGRGITVCERWRGSFENFLDDMGSQPRDGQRWSIDRVDNDGDYEPLNCRWALPSEQSHNGRHTVKDDLEYADLSRQRKWQLRMRREGRCTVCARPAPKFCGYCELHYARQLERVRWRTLKVGKEQVNAR